VQDIPYLDSINCSREEILNEVSQGGSCHVEKSVWPPFWKMKGEGERQDLP
jgi:hypothetical protein